MDLYLIIILVLLFFVGTLLLIKKKCERYLGIIFLIRTKCGIKFIEKLSKLPGWKFIADFAVVASLSGIGALYLSSQGREKNLPFIFLIFGAFACFLTFSNNISLFVAALLFIFLFSLIIRKFPNPYFIFCIFSILIFIIAAKGHLIIFPHAQIEILATLPISILISIFGLPAFVIGLLTTHAFEIIFKGSELPGVSPLLPTVKDGKIGFGFLGYDDFFIPIWCGIIALIIIITFHEISHGVLSRVHKINVRSTGLLTFGIIPIGAFVEPDEEQVKKCQGYKKMQIYVMGSFGNFAIAIICALILASVLSVAFNHDEGMSVKGIIKNSPAYYANLSEGTIIYKINNESPWKAMQNLPQNKTIYIETNKGNLTLTTVEHPDIEGIGYVGIIYSAPINKNFENFENFIHIFVELLRWIIFLNFLVGITNLMPISPLDGGKIIEEVIASINLNKKIMEHIIFGIIAIMLFLLIINAFPILKIISKMF